VKTRLTEAVKRFVHLLLKDLPPALLAMQELIDLRYRREFDQVYD
jgi:hypothetical protein